MKQIYYMAGKPIKHSGIKGRELPLRPAFLKREETVAKSKEKYDAEVKKLKDLYAKQDEMKKKELFAAVEKSAKSYEEIMAFMQEEVRND